MTRRYHDPLDKKFIAGELCLDFANTVDWRASGAPVELLKTCEDLVTWGRRAGLVDMPTARRFFRESQKRPDDAAAVLKRAVTVREAIYGLALALLQLRRPSAKDLEIFNRELRIAFQHRKVVPGHQGLSWNWDSRNRDLEELLWPILRSAAELLTSERHARVRQCADDRGCGWLFLDTTKNHSRRWCAMEDCGNRAKARRHYQRIRAPKAKITED